MKRTEFDIVLIAKVHKGLRDQGYRISFKEAVDLVTDRYKRAIDRYHANYIIAELVATHIVKEERWRRG